MFGMKIIIIAMAMHIRTHIKATEEIELIDGMAWRMEALKN
jgi:hypothetical protein